MTLLHRLPPLAPTQAGAAKRVATRKAVEWLFLSLPLIFPSLPLVSSLPSSRLGGSHGSSSDGNSLPQLLKWTVARFGLSTSGSSVPLSSVVSSHISAHKLLPAHSTVAMAACAIGRVAGGPWDSGRGCESLLQVLSSSFGWLLPCCLHRC